MPNPGRSPGWLQRLLLIVGGGLVTLVVLELALWVAHYPLTNFPQGMFQEDERIGYHRLSPDFHGTVRSWEVNYQVDTNAIGMRGGALRTRQEVGWRLLGLGDSFTFGVGVDEEHTYLRQLEHLLNHEGRSSAAGSVEVLNAGVPGYGTVHELRYLERIGLRYEPDLVLLGFYVANDLSDNAPQSLRTVQGFLVPQGQVNFVNVKIWLRHHFRTYACVADTLKHQKRLGDILAHVGLVKLADPGMNVRYQAVQFYLKAPPAEVLAMWQQAEELLVRMRNLLQQHDSRLVVVIIPDRISVYERWLERAVRQAGRSIAEFDGAQPHHTLAALCQRHQIPFLDLLPVMRETASQESGLYFDYDGHWTPAGHRVAAQTIFRFLKANPSLREAHGTAAVSMVNSHLGAA